MENERFVVVTTDANRKGVFAGYLLSEKNDGVWTVELSDAKMAVHWSENVKGVLGLANTGPLQGCRISPSVTRIKIDGVTAIMDCTEKSIKNWKKDTWD